MKRIFFENHGQECLWFDVDQYCRICDNGFEQEVDLSDVRINYDLMTPGVELEFSIHILSPMSLPTFIVSKVVDLQPISYTAIKQGDSVYWWLEDKVEQGGGVWCLYHAKNAHGGIVSISRWI